MKIKNIQVRGDGATRLDEVIFEIYDDADQFVAKQGIGGFLQSLGDNPTQETIVNALAIEARKVINQIEANNRTIRLIDTNALTCQNLPVEIEIIEIKEEAESKKSTITASQASTFKSPKDKSA